VKINNIEVKDYIYTDSATECVDGLKFISFLLDTVLENANNWKWVIIALHNTVQNFMVITLRDSAGVNILRKKIQGPYYKSLVEGTLPRPKEILDDFMNLYKSTKDPDEMRKYMDSTHFIPTKRQDESMSKLNTMRNEFIHFVPKGLVAYISGMPDIISDCLDYIDFLVFQSFHLPFHRDEDESDTERLIKEIKSKSDHIFSVFVELSEERKSKKQKKGRI
jgi:hypothetical protein